jgi:hypothetical protein
MDPHHAVDEIRFPNITALLTTHGHSPDKAADIILLARHNDAPARQWIKVLARADAARDRYQQAIEASLPASQLTFRHAATSASA